MSVAGNVEHWLSYLRSAQNADGGWSFRPGLQSRVEPTSWVLLALRKISSTTDEVVSGGVRFLQATQLRDGSWPSTSEQEKGCWVTALACWALAAQEQTSEVISPGIRWLCERRPGDSGLVWRWIRHLTAAGRITAQDSSCFGWGWTPGTASWVEPTAITLIALASCPATLLPSAAQTRRQIAEAMLYDRMCRGGGWNCGNPMVYGVPGEPLIAPTVWTLLALRANPLRPENRTSLDWLEKNWMKVKSPAALALAQLGLSAYGRNDSALATSLLNLCNNEERLWTVPTVAWLVWALIGSETATA